MESILQTYTQVRFQDCDPFNHLNNSKYLDYFINAREDQVLEHYGIDFYKLMKEQGIGWVVGTSQIMYLNPAITMETVLIESQIIKYSGKSLTVEMRMWDKDRSRIKALLWSNYIHFNLRTQRSESHSDEFMSLFSSVHQPVEQPGFEERGRTLAVKFAKAS